MRRILIIVFVLVMTMDGRAQKSDPTLYKQIAHMDSVLFNAFNTQDLQTLRSLFADNLEFFHDKGGLSNYEQNMSALEKLFAQQNGMRRTLVSMEVYPVPGYGAIQDGTHKFCHEENGKNECAVFKFLHVWEKKNNEWKITRVISYDHK